MTPEERLPAPTSPDFLATDLSGLSDEELGRLFDEADRSQGEMFLLKCKIVFTYRANKKGRESWVDAAKQQFRRSRRTLESYANIWDAYCELDVDAQARTGGLTDSAALMAHIGRLGPLSRPLALRAAISYLDETGQIPTVAVARRLTQVAQETDATSAGYSVLPPADHSAIQFRLMVLGTALGYDVWVPDADRGRAMRFGTGERLSLREFLPQLDPGNLDAQNTISRIDAIWLERGGGYVAAFEVERTTAVHSGILRLSDLASVAPNVRLGMFIVAPADRGWRVIRELNRPTFRKEPLALHKRCRLVIFEDLVSETDVLGDRVRMLKGAEFLRSISKECERPTADFPEDSDE